MGWIFFVLPFISWTIQILIVAWIVSYFLRRRRGRKSLPSENKHWYWQFALSREDGISQWFLLLSVFFLGLTLLAFNRDLHDPLDWRTVILFTSVAGLVITYYFKTVATLIFSLIGIIGWWVAQVGARVLESGIPTSYIAAGVMLIALFYYVFGHYHEMEMKYKRFALVYMILGIILVTGALFYFSSKIGLVLLVEMTKGASFFSSWELTTFLLLFFLALAGLTFYSVSRKLLLIPEAAGVVILALISFIIAFFPLQTVMPTGMSSSSFLFSDLGGELSPQGVLLSVVFNFVLFFELLGLIFSGYLRREEWLINIGALFLFIFIIVKYFDWFFTFMDKSLFFIGAGILLFAVGWFMEKSRRYVVANIKAEQQKMSL